MIIDISEDFDVKQRPIVRQMVELALSKLPEYNSDRLMVDRIEDCNGVLGKAYVTETYADRIALRFIGLSMHTIGHEIAHFLRYKKRINIPSSEPATDIFITARDEIFNDAPCEYINYSKEIFDRDRKLWRGLCLKAMEYYKQHGKYIWIQMLKEDIKKEVKKNGYRL